MMGRMTQELKTLGEATLALKGITDQFSIYAKGFGTVIVAGTAVAGFLAWQIVDLARDVGSIEARTANIEITAMKVEAKLDMLTREFTEFRADTNASLAQIKEALRVPTEKPAEGPGKLPE